MREIEKNSDGRLRFKKNRVVGHLLECGKTARRCNLNDIWSMAQSNIFSTEEMREFYQLIGYTLSGYREIFQFLPKEEIEAIESKSDI